MRVDDFDYPLPEELIAHYPPQERRASRLMVVGPEYTLDQQFPDLLSHLQPQDCLIFNNTRVMRARIFGQKATTGGQIECLVERILTESLALCHLRASKSPLPGSFLQFGAHKAQVKGREGAFYLISLTDTTWLELMDEQGELPLPPYMHRAPEAEDAERYQTVYSQPLGAVAAPTAGLHFDQALLKEIEARGIGMGFVTLHVGAGTFLPMRVETLAEHRMHSEWVEVPQTVVDLVNQTRARGGRVFAVGTTTVRSLETAASKGTLEPFFGDTQLFITPGFKFKAVDAMITNFHLPKSTLMILVSAFMGKERMFHAYAHAIKARYRFFSYGDAMLLLPRGKQP